MSALSPTRRKLRSQKAVAVRLGHAEEAQRIDAEIRTEALADHIRQVVDAAPPLSPEQRRRLVFLLNAGSAS